MNQSNTKKRTYQKPYLVMESLQMAGSIAAGCTSTVQQNNAAGTECVVYIPELGTNAFTTEVVCGNDIFTADNVLNMCYNNPSETTKLFMS